MPPRASAHIRAWNCPAANRNAATESLFAETINDFATRSANKRHRPGSQLGIRDFAERDLWNIA
jgi:hypothetical protein